MAVMADAKRSNRRRFWPLGVGFVFLLAVLAFFALQGGGGSGAGGPLNAIAEAAAKTQHQGGGRAVLRGIIRDPERSKPIILTGRLVYNGDWVTRGTMTVPDPGSSQPVRLDFMQDGTVVYMRSSKFGTLPEGREWMGLDFALGEDLDTSVPTGSDAHGELELLEKAGGAVEKVGKENVRGVPTTRYRSRLGVAESAKRLREAGAEDTPAIVEKHASPLQLEAWIDGKGLVRRMRVFQLRPAPGEEKTIDMRTDFFDFGFEPEIELPDSDEVFDATSLAKEELESSDE
jgi:hypothetical protein